MKLSSRLQKDFVLCLEYVYVFILTPLSQGVSRYSTKAQIYQFNWETLSYFLSFMLIPFLTVFYLFFVSVCVLWEGCGPPSKEEVLWADTLLLGALKYQLC